MRRIARTPARSVALWLCSVAVATAADEPQFRYAKPVQRPAAQQEELVAIRLDAEAMKEASQNFADVRLVDADGEAVPYLIRKSPELQSRIREEPFSPEERTLRPLPDGGLEIIVRLDEDAPNPEAVRIVSPLTDFEQRVQVFTSAEGDEWQPLGEPQTIFDYSRYMDVRRDTVELPPTDAREFRLVIEQVNVPEESQQLKLLRRMQQGEQVERIEQTQINRRPFRINRIVFVDRVSEGRVTGTAMTEYPLEEWSVRETSDGRQLVMLRTNRMPLTRIAVSTPDANFSRPVELQLPVDDTDERWRTIAEDRIRKIALRDLQEESLSVTFSQTRAETMRLVLINGDGPAIEIDEVQTEGPVYELVAFLAPAEQYRLLYGADVRPPRYDTAAISEVLRRGTEPVTAALGPQQPREFTPTPSSWFDRLQKPALLIGLIVVLAAVLSWALWSAVKRVDGIAEAETQ